jgi:propionate CoA-transferase
MVEAVEHVTFSGNRVRTQGQEVIYITERCVIRLTENGLLATEIMPGIDPARDIVAASDDRVKLPDGAITLPLSILAQAPMGLQL